MKLFFFLFATMASLTLAHASNEPIDGEISLSTPLFSDAERIHFVITGPAAEKLIQEISQWKDTFSWRCFESAIWESAHVSCRRGPEKSECIGSFSADGRNDGNRYSCATPSMGVINN